MILDSRDPLRCSLFVSYASLASIPNASDMGILMGVSSLELRFVATLVPIVEALGGERILGQRITVTGVFSYLEDFHKQRFIIGLTNDEALVAEREADGLVISVVGYKKRRAMAVQIIAESCFNAFLQNDIPASVMLLHPHALQIAAPKAA